MMKQTQHTLANAAQRTLALFVVATMTVVPAVAMTRAPRLHAAAHPAGHVVATRATAAHAHTRHAERYEEAEARPSKHGKKAAPTKDRLEPKHAHGKDSRSKRREPEYVDDPVVMHRAKSHARPLTRRERLQELAWERKQEAAEARYQATHKATKHVQERPPVETVATRETIAADSQYASREYKASYDNVAHAVDKTGRPNAFSRQSRDAEIGEPLRATPAGSVQGTSRGANSENSPVAGQAKPTSVVVRRPQPLAQISASDAPLSPAQHYQPRVATGFGAELAPLQQAAQRDNLEARALAAEAQDLGEDLAVNGVPSTHTLAADAMQPLVTPMYNREGNLMMPSPLRGSHEILVHQNVMADHDGLERIQDDYQLNRMLAQHTLVSFPESASLRVNEGLPGNRRYARPWTVQFAADAARAFYQRFGEPLQVNSAVRTVSYQLRLQRVNGNAAATRGEGASPHLTGQAIDLAKRGMSADQLAWMRTYLLPFIDAGKIDVEEEFRQACFHISVYRAYLPPVHHAPVQQIAQYRPLPATAATALPYNPDTDQ